MGYYKIYRDPKSQFRWRYVASNGKIIGMSSEAYVHKVDCQRSIDLMKASTNAPVYEET